MPDDGNYEIIDGQQRTVSICLYLKGDFSFEMRYFHNLQTDETEAILNYKLMMYFCEESPVKNYNGLKPSISQEQSSKTKSFVTLSFQAVG